MKWNKYSAALLFGVCSLFPNSVKASLFIPPIIQKVDTSNGATDGVINDMVTDEYGRLWLASAEGIFVYGGEDAINIGEEFDFLNDEAANSLLIHDDILWAAGSFGLLRVSLIDLKITLFDEVPGKAYEALAYKDNHIWLGSNDAGVSIFNIIERKLTPFNIEEYVDSKNIKSILVDGETIWILAYGTDSSNDFIHGGLIQVSNKKVINTFYTDEKVAFSSMLLRGDVLHLASTNQGVSRFNKSSEEDLGKVYQIENFPKTNDIAIDKNGCIWLASLSGLSSVCGQKISNYHHETEFLEQLPARDLYSIHFDEKNNMLWVGGIYGGASGISLNNADILKYSLVNPGQNSITSDDVYTLHTSSTGDLWIGYNGAGIDIVDGETLEVENIKITQEDTRANHVISIFEHSDGRFFLGTFGGGVWVKNLSGNFLPFINDSNESFQSTVVTGFVEDGDFLWIATIRELIKATNDGTVLKTLPQADIIDDGLIFGIEQIDTGRLFLATNAGPIALDKESFEQTHFRDIAPENGECHNSNILDVARNSSGVLIYQNASLCAFNPQNNEISKLLPETEFSDGNAIYLVNDSQVVGAGGSLTIADLGELSSVKIDKSVGHFIDSTVPHFGAITYFRGQIVTGNTRGLLWTNVNSIPFDNLPSNPLFLEGLTVMNEAGPVRELSNSRDLVITADEKIVIADFMKVDYFNSGYQYQANMPSIIDTPLTLSRLSNFVVPTGVEGLHEITIESLSGKTVIDDFTFNITVQPPWWRSTIAYFTYIILLILSTWLLVLYKQRKLKVDKTNLEKTIKERTSQLHDAMRKKERLFENVSHEFRTPLTIILGQISKYYKKDDEQSLILRQQTEKMLELVNSLLSLAEVKALSEDYEIIDLQQRLSLAIESFRTLCDDKNLAIISELTKSYQQLKVRRGTIDLLINNLLSNAIKYSLRDTEIFVTTSILNGDLTLVVKNQSNKIDIDSALQRFSKSQTFDSSSGLGLDIVSELTTVLKGTFKLSQEDGWVTAVAQIPITLVDKTDTNSELKSFNSDESPKEGNILIVEDNIELGTYLFEVLSIQFNVEIKTNGQQALDFLSNQEQTPDLILSDVMMPRINGIELCEAVKKDRLLSSIPFLLLTAKGDQASQEKGYQAGADDYILKPFNESLLITKVSNLIGTFQKAKAKAEQALYSSTTTSDDEFSVSLGKILEKQFSDSDLKPEDIAKQLNMSSKTLNRRLSVHFGKNFSELLKIYRIEKSIQLIIKGRPLKQVTYDCGFSSQSYFTKCFKQVTGKTPQSFVKAP